MPEFNNLTSLADIINDDPSFKAYVEGGVLYIKSEDSNQNLSFINTGATNFTGVLGLNNTSYTSGILDEFDLTRNVIPAAYEAAGTNAANMAGSANTVLASGLNAVDISFERNFPVYDALGVQHEFFMGYIKIDINTWAVEVYSKDLNEITLNRSDGQIASGTIEFNGDGTLRSVTGTIASPIGILWQNGAIRSDISINWGTPGITGTGLSDGLRQFQGEFLVNNISQNGVNVSDLSSVAITQDGVLVANFNNGLSRELYQIPLAEFANPDGLIAVNNNMFIGSYEAGDFNLREAYKNGMGSIQSRSLEKSNVDLTTELTRMILNQRVYEANSQSMSVGNDLLKQLNRLFN